VEVSEWEGEAAYISALASYNEGVRRKLPGRGFKNIAAEYHISHSRLQKMYTRDCERRRRAMESDEDSEYM